MGDSKYTDWHRLRGNTEFLNCYKAFAATHKTYRKDEYYNFSPEGTRIEPVKKIPRELRRTTNDNKRLVKYKKYLDGPTQIVGSLETMNPDGSLVHGDPTKLKLSSALQRCYQMAIKDGKRYFGLQFGGHCFGTNKRSRLDFLEVAPDNECVACKKTCKKGEKVCGKKCLAASEKCDTKLKGACAHDSPLLDAKAGSMRGGYFTMVMFRIKSMNYNTIVPRMSRKDLFAKYHYPKPNVSKGWNCDVNESGLFELSTTQKYVTSYFTPNTPGKGLILHQNAGSGKTCAMLNILGNFMPEKWNYIWVTRESLTDVPRTDMFYNVCLNALRERIDSDEPIKDSQNRVRARTRAEKIKFIRSRVGQQVMAGEKNGGINFYDYRVVTYDEFVRFLSNSGTTRSKYLYKKQTEGQRGAVKDPLKNTIVLIDEVHNLTSDALPAGERVYLERNVPSRGRPSWARNGDMTGRDLIFDAVHHSYKVSKRNSVKIVGATATPMSTSVTELFWLLNLMEPVKKYHLKMDVKRYVDMETNLLIPRGVIEFTRIADGKISYFNNGRDPTKFPQKVLRQRQSPVMMDFYRRNANEILEEVRRKNPDLTGKDIIELYQNLEVACMSQGKTFSVKQIEKYEKSLKGGNDFAKEYRDNIEKARRSLKITITKKDRKDYAVLRNKYAEWLDKRGGVRDAGMMVNMMDINGDSLSIEKWKRREKSADDDVPDEIRGIVSDGEILEVTEWVDSIKKINKKLTKAQEKYEHYLMRDPDTGEYTLKTEEQYVATQREGGIPGSETTSTTFLMYHAKYNPKVVKTLLPYYCPDIHACIENIIRLEAESPSKHVVMSFSNASRSFRAFGSHGTKLLASAFNSYSDKFHIMMGYKYTKVVDTRDGQEVSVKGHILNNDVPEGKWGVVLLSTVGVPNKNYTKNKGPKVVTYGPSIRRTTVQAFNDESNKNGSKIKVILLDKEFVEGVSIYNASRFHAIGNPVSRGQFEQASSRPGRNCRSGQLPFYDKKGAFLDIYTYRSKYMSEGSLSDDMLVARDKDELWNMNMIEAFSDLSREVSIDYWLNEHGDYSPTYKGTIVEVNDDSYVINTVMSRNGREGEMAFLVDFDSVLTGFGDTVVVDQVAYHIKSSRGNKVHLVDSSTGAETTMNRAVVAHPVGTKVEYKLPYGVDMVSKLLNIGNRSLYSASHKVSFDDIPNLRNPANALKAGSMAFSGSRSDVLIGIAGLLKDSLPLSPRAPVTFNFPDDLSTQSMAFTYAGGVLGNNIELLKRMLSVKSGMSISLLYVTDYSREEIEDIDKVHYTVNFLIYIPKWGVVERFDPRGSDHSTAELDAQLHDLFRVASRGIDREISYMSALLSAPRKSFQRISGGDEVHTAAAFSLFYIHARIKYLIDALESDVDALTYPRAFTEKLLCMIPVNETDKYIREYARSLVEIKKDITVWKSYDSNVDININTIEFIKAMLKHNAPKGSEHLHRGKGYIPRKGFNPAKAPKPQKGYPKRTPKGRGGKGKYDEGPPSRQLDSFMSRLLGRQ